MTQLLRNQAAVIAALIGLYYLSRLPGLLSLPIFVDESVMLAQAWQILRQTPDFHEILGDHGKLVPALATAGTAALGGIPNIVSGNDITAGLNWLLYGRIATVTAGAVAMLGCYRLGHELWNPVVGAVAAVLYILLPYSYFHDRLTISEPYLYACGIWTTVHSLRIARGTKGDPLLLAICMILGLLSKTLPALFFAALPIWTWLWFAPWSGRAKSSLLLIAGSYVALSAAAAASVFVFGTKRAQEVAGLFFGHLGRDQFSGRTLTVQSVWDSLVSHAQELPDWMSHYLTEPGIVLLAFSTAAALRLRDRASCFLLASSILFSLCIMAPPTWVAPRYLAPAVVLLLPAVAAGVIPAMGILMESLQTGTRRPLNFTTYSKQGIGLMAALAILALFASSVQFIWTANQAPEKLSIPDVDRYQYISGWASGYGFQEALDWILSENPSDPLPVLVTNNRSFRVLSRYSGIDIKMTYGLRGLLGHADLRKIVEESKGRVYTIINTPFDGTEIPQNPHGVAFDPGFSYTKPGGQSSVYAYRITLTPYPYLPLNR